MRRLTSVLAIPVLVAAGCVAAPAAPGERARELLAVGEARLARYERGRDPDDLDRAARALNRALQLDPRLYPAHRALAEWRYHRGEYDLEVNEYRLCLAIHPGHAPALLRLGHASLTQGDVQTARDAYRRLLAIEPRQPEAAFNLLLLEEDLLARCARDSHDACRDHDAASLEALRAAVPARR